MGSGGEKGGVGYRRRAQDGYVEGGGDSGVLG
eukprot:CAMPEP_0171679908 /NCGR_PEP_ID=MMETSP0990-20121206/56529_1 /TAXON_ID=483369 /ORGANISM="non described non described, Strain CCMP2098" /LENGTH=31 /DNA_ID= /DNA_START= /DNA_END= /DNA_ORIENTATION=